MFSNAHYPSQPLTGEELDQYLLEGWFRMGQSIFTCTYLGLNHGIYRVFWLRVVLDGIGNDKTFKKLSKLNSKFSIKIQEASITPEKEALYQAYKTGIRFEPSESLQMLLYKGSQINIYNSLELNIYDGEKLIAVGYFDLGQSGAAGINCFYDPAYKKYSLGKYLIYQKLLYCKNEGMQHFYLGYFAPGCKAFDYKLDIAKHALEYLDLSSEKWYGINMWDPVSGSIEETRQKLTIVQHQLDKVNIENRLMRYGYFQANLFPDFQGYQLFDYLMFVYCFNFHPDVVNPIVVYDFRNVRYHLLKCISVGRAVKPENDEEVYSSHLLKTQKSIYSTDNVEELAEVIAAIYANSKKDHLTV